jgi:hypothetical protein
VAQVTESLAERGTPSEQTLKPRSSGWLIFAFRIGLGSLLLYDGLLKARHPYDLLSGIYELELVGPKLGILIATVLPWVEILCALCLLGGVFLSGALLISAGVFGAYAFTSATALNWGLSTNYRPVPFGKPFGVLSLVCASFLLLLTLTAYISVVVVPRFAVSAAWRKGVGVFLPLLRVRRRRVRAAVAAGVLAAACMVAVVLGHGSSGPIVFESSSIEFGELSEGDLAKRRFTFRNQGEEEIEVLQVRGTCACINAQPAQKSIAPGETGSIEVRLDTRGIEGRNEFPLFVHVDADRQKLIELSVSANVHPSSKAL